MYMEGQQRSAQKAQTIQQTRLCFLCLCGRRLLTLAVSTVPTEIAATRVLELAVALGADADHVGHDGAGDRLLLWVKLGLLFAHRAGGVR